MAVTPVAFGVAIGSKTDADGHYRVTPAGNGAMVLSTTATADMATLVADGASPTQAHVTAMNTAFGAMVGPLNALHVASTVSIVFDTTGITTMNQLKAALKNLELQIRGSGLLTQ